MNIALIKKYWPMVAVIFSTGGGVTGAGYAVNINVDLHHAQTEVINERKFSNEILNTVQALGNLNNCLGETDG